MTIERIHIPKIPGVTWRRFCTGVWEARWKPYPEMVQRGYSKDTHRLWSGTELTQKSLDLIVSRAASLQSSMIVWGKGGLPQSGTYDGTIASLVRAYQTDPDSRYRKVEYASKVQYDKLCRRIVHDIGERKIEKVIARDFNRWYENWLEASGVSMAHSLISMVRLLTGFGALILEDKECLRIRGLLSLEKFKNGERRQVILSFPQAEAVCNLARERYGSPLALAQALQFETAARQKDAIGAWVPETDRTPSDIIDHDRRWIKGIRWNEIDGNFILRHRTSKKKKWLIADLTLAPLVLNELALAYPGFKTDGGYDRNALPSSGPMIVDPGTGLPYSDNTYRDHWRKIATALGIPKGIQNRDSRSGAATEGFAAGANADDMRKLMTHSQLSTTMLYSRGEEEAAARAQRARIESRTKASGT